MTPKGSDRTDTHGPFLTSKVYVISKQFSQALHCPIWPTSEVESHLGKATKIAVRISIYCLVLKLSSTCLSLPFALLIGTNVWQVRLLSSQGPPTSFVHFPLIPLCRTDKALILNGKVPNLNEGELMLVKKLQKIPSSVAACLKPFSEHKPFQFE